MNDYKLSNVEKETIITFNETGEPAGLYTFNKKLLKQMEQLVKERPDEVQLHRDNKDGSKDFYLPKKWIKIRPSRILSEEEKAIRANRFKGGNDSQE